MCACTAARGVSDGDSVLARRARRLSLPSRLGLIAVLVTGLGVMNAGPDVSGKAQDIRGTTAGECGLPPVDVPLFGGTPAAIIAATPSGDVQSGATDVDQAAIHSAVANIIACVNTGDPSFQFAIFTPRYLAAQFVEPAGHYQPEFEWLLDTPAQPATSRFELVSIENVEGQPDGRVHVTLVLHAEQETFRDTLALANVDGHWLIDEVVALDPVP